MDEKETMLFLKEREEALGGKIIYKTFSTWFAELGGVKREYGIFLCTDGKTVMFEDFDREPQLLGIPLKKKNKEEYRKMVVTFPPSAISSIDRVRLKDADKAFRAGIDTTKSAGAISRAFCKLVTKVVLDDGRIMFFEFMDHKEFVKKMTEFKKEASNGSI